MMRSRAHAAWMAFALLCTSLESKSARAEGSGVDEASAARADQLFREGAKKFDAGQLEEACQSFAASLKFDPELGTLLNLALCHEKLGRTSTAWAEFTHGAAWATQTGEHERRRFANEHAIALEARMSRVLLVLPATRGFSSIELDGEPLPEPTWYLPMFLDPGVHTIAASAPGKIRRADTIDVVEGPSTQSFTVKPLEDAPPAVHVVQSVQATYEETNRTKRASGIVGIGLGVVGVGVGAGFGIATIGKRNDIGVLCTGNVCTPAGATIHDAAQHDATISTIAFASGAILAVAGTWLYLTSTHRTSQTSIAGRARIAVTPSVLAHGGALGLVGSW